MTTLPSGQAEQQAILALERDTFAAIQKKDARALRAILADDFVFRAPGTPDAGREEFLRGIEAIPAEILEVWSDDLKVSLYGDIAVLTGVQKARTRGANGAEELSAQAFTDIFARHKGRWVMVLAYSAEIPVPQAPGKPAQSQP